MIVYKETPEEKAGKWVATIVLSCLIGGLVWPPLGMIAFILIIGSILYIIWH